jgi:hypothetical protein
MKWIYQGSAEICGYCLDREQIPDPLEERIEADSITSMLSNNFSILKRAGLEVEPILGANLTILILKEFFPFPKRISRIPTLGRGAGSCSL